MPKTYAYQVDDETAALIEADKDRLSRAVGLNPDRGEGLTPSQYHRMVMGERIHQGRTPFQVGWQEGFLAAYGDVKATISKALKKLYEDNEDDDEE